jgi:hypothetical protein
MSNVIPACKVRPLPETDSFLGYQLMVFAKKTKKHVVFDAQVSLEKFIRTGIWTCKHTCDPNVLPVSAGRMDLKDDFLRGKGDDFGHSVSVLCLTFFEDDVCLVKPMYASGKQRDFQIIVDVCRGYDYKRRTPDAPPAYRTLSFLFNDCGKSLLKWVKEQTKNV